MGLSHRDLAQLLSGQPSEPGEQESLQGPFQVHEFLSESGDQLLGSLFLGQVDQVQKGVSGEGVDRGLLVDFDVEVQGRLVLVALESTEGLALLSLSYFNDGGDIEDLEFLVI